MLASLPMYDFPELREATDGFWAAVAEAYGLTGELTRGPDWSAPWRNGDLLFSQTCGYPFTHEFAGQLKYIATPHYDADGCNGPHYSSIIFAREKSPLEKFRNTTAAYNSEDSMSGMLALRLVFAPLQNVSRHLPFFARQMKTGSHVASLAAVRNAQADVCAIDCVTVALLRKHRPTALEGLVEIARSPSVPALPFVTRSGNIARLRHAVHHAAQTPAARHLLMTSVSVLPASAYQQILSLEAALNT